MLRQAPEVYDAQDDPPFHPQAEPQPEGKAPNPPHPEQPRHTRIADTVRYLYLMRFSVLLWLSMILLTVVDFTSSASITRGILTPFLPWQWFFTGLAVALPGWFALLAARIVCAYGQDRFGITPPPWFEIVDRMEWFAFWGAQIPGLCLLARVAYNVRHEGESKSYLPVLVCLFLGAFAALVFWYLVSVLYYWIWDPESTVPSRAFLVPHWSAIPLDEIEHAPCGDSPRRLSRLMNGLGRLGPGYCTRDGAHPRQTRTAPGHIVATLTLLGAILMYSLLMPISAPVPVPSLAWAGRIASLLLAVYILRDFVRPAWRGFRHGRVPPTGPQTGSQTDSQTGPQTAPQMACSGKQMPPRLSRRARTLPLLSALLLLGLLAFGIVSPHAPRAIPVIAYVVTLLVVIFWTMAGIAFYADHYRLPVITTATLIILGLNHWPAEHVFPVRPIDGAIVDEPLVSPPDFVRRIAFGNNLQDDEPVVIITATGGGIHAAAWTATTLRALDDAFRAAGIPLSHHILLMSSVSGGSVATAGFLREYFTPDAFSSHSYDRVEATAACSSLQAVAWGLAYPDTLRLLFPFVFNAFPSLDRFDRGWALQRAIDHNLHDEQCIKDRATRDTGGPSLSNLTLNTLSRLDPASRLCREHAGACAHFPAFTLNSTVVETGDRFLLSNYSVFADKAGTYEVLPAASFLGVYARNSILPLPRPAPIPDRGFADISILTAARLSASFTYVSPATRLPFENADPPLRNAYHFVDGGYYDNDGTNSAIEFLKAASIAFQPAHPLRVLLIEIRNSDDLNINDSPDSYAYQASLKWDGGKQAWYLPPKTEKHRMGPIGELLAPPEAAKNAGFGSTTARNRRELDTLQRAFCGSLELQHVILDYQQEIRHAPDGKTVLKGESELDQPLSWHLTARQREWISGPNTLDGKSDYALDRKQPISDRTRILQSVGWFKAAQARAHTPIAAAVACKQNNLNGQP